MKLEELCNVDVDMHRADFWIKAFGPKDEVGTVHKVYNAHDIGIKVVRTDILHPDYLFYVFQYLKMTGQLDELMIRDKTGCRLTLRSIKNISFSQQQ